MNIRFHEASRIDNPWLQQSILDLLHIADGEVLPPLTTRGGGTPEENLNGVFQKELGRKLVYAVDEENPSSPILAGYLAYEDGHVAEMSNGGCPCRYVIRVIVRPDYRGQGIAGRLYERLVCISDGLPGFGVRTWTTNHAHRKALDRCGFVEDGVIKDDRGAGVDSIYYWKSLG